ncbi:anthocyanidin reductase-like [Dorcoceras hygrometricum]|uniref:Anthocyanidin reductase-like n=1 Tax=Dorcoceras hygrometricum TaxID=472368 RepID=A0A2Z7ARA5_9LAMI|nr:anthocyanidin reductase-like [Dorcoceras hygrometricum]
MEKGSCRVCVTGGSGYIASLLVKKLLNEGYTVHATVRKLDDHPKIDILKSFHGADTRLKLFVADIYKPEEFDEAIQGCEFVFHVATPLLHSTGFKHNNRVDATVDSARILASLCIRSGTVRRLIYTASVVAASPLKEDGSGYKELMDETCWTPLDFSNPYSDIILQEYTQSKTLAEKEILRSGDGKIEVVSLVCGLVGGETQMPSPPGSLLAILSLLTNDEPAYNSLKFLEELLARVPILHIEDACNAHIFCMKQDSINGRFLCSNGYVSTAEIAGYYRSKYPELSINKDRFDCLKRDTKWVSTLLCERGFEYKFDWKMVLDDSVRYAKETQMLVGLSS